MIFLNKPPIIWYIKSQLMVEVSAFYSNFIALKYSNKDITALRFKIHILGIQMQDDGSDHMFYYNESVVRNYTNIESILNKKESDLVYNYLQLKFSAGIVIINCINNADNLTDDFMKQLSETYCD